MTTRKIAAMGVLSALSIVLMLLIHFPIFPAAPFLEYDVADVPLFIGTFMYGPLAGFCMTAVVCVIQGVTVSAASGIIGIAMHLAATGSFVLVSGLIYKKFHTYKGAIAALVCGVVIWNITMVLWNILLTPIFMGIPRSEIYKLLPIAILPFNLIKATANSLITLLLYKFTHKLITKYVDHDNPLNNENLSKDEFPPPSDGENDNDDHI